MNKETQRDRMKAVRMPRLWPPLLPLWVFLLLSAMPAECCCALAQDAGASSPQNASQSGSRALTDLIYNTPTDPAAIRAAIGSGVDPNRIDENGETPLGLAARLDKRSAAEALLAAGANPNARGSNGWTPLFWAVSDLSLVRLLVSHGADVRAQGSGGYTLLMRAAWEGALDTCRFLIARGVPVGAKDASGNTALHSAAQKGRASLIRLLLTAGADPTVESRHGRYTGPGFGTALESAASACNIEAVAELLKDKRVLRQHDALQRSLFWAVSTPLYAHGRVVGKYPRGMSGTVALLLEHGARATLRNMQGQTPLLLSLSELQVEDYFYLFYNFPAYFLLIRAGVEINAQDTAGRTALMLACWKALELVPFLLDKGARTDLRDREGRTALMYLVTYPIYDSEDPRFSAKARVMARSLLLKGADRSARDKDGKTAYDLAKAAGNDYLLDMLDPSSPLPDPIDHQ